MAIYKRPNSKFYWMKFYFDGELIQKSTQVSNKKDAQTIESAYRTQLALGKIGIKPKPKAQTLKRAVEDFLQRSKIEHANKPNTHTRNIYSCKPLTKFFGETKVDSIAQKDVERFIAWRSGQTSRKTGEFISRDCINLELIALKTIFKRLVSSGILSENPAREIKQLPKSERTFHVITYDEERIYLMACPQPLRDVAILMLATGMRPKEICQLKRENVSTEKGFVQIVGGKTKASNRKVWLSDKAADVLRVRMEKCQGEYLFPKNEREVEKPLVQPDKLHSPTVKRIGLQFRLYDARHTFASRVLEHGIDLLTLAALLGHSSLNHVMIYSHPSESHKQEAIQRMQRTGKQKQFKAA